MIQDPDDYIVKAYKNIKAPDSLRQRVLDSASHHTKSRRSFNIATRALAAVASFAIVVAAVFALRGRAPDVSSVTVPPATLIYDGVEVADERVEIELPEISTVMLELRSTPVGIPFTLKINKTVTVSVEGGSVEICGVDGNPIAYADGDAGAVVAFDADADGEELTLQLYWSCTGEMSTLTVGAEDGQSETSYRLTTGESEKESASIEMID